MVCVLVCVVCICCVGWVMICDGVGGMWFLDVCDCYIYIYDDVYLFVLMVMFWLFYVLVDVYWCV